MCFMIGTRLGKGWLRYWKMQSKLSFRYLLKWSRCFRKRRPSKTLTSIRDRLQKSLVGKRGKVRTWWAQLQCSLPIIPRLPTFSAELWPTLRLTRDLFCDVRTWTALETIAFTNHPIMEPSLQWRVVSLRGTFQASRCLSLMSWLVIYTVWAIIGSVIETMRMWTGWGSFSILVGELI